MHATTVSSFVLSYGGAPRRVRVAIPRDVEAAPSLLLLFDGQNVLGDEGSHAGGWHAHQAIPRLPKTVRRPVIVAVDHGYARRIDELWHHVDPFLRFVTHEVLPAAEHHARRRFDPEARVIGGSSLGGLASQLALARHPRIFRGAIAMSPSMWVSPRAFLHELRHAHYVPGTRAYVDVGYRESPAMIRCARAVPDVLAARLPPAQILWRPDRRGRHREKDWRRRLPKALRFAFHR